MEYGGAQTGAGEGRMRVQRMLIGYESQYGRHCAMDAMPGACTTTLPLNTCRLHARVGQDLSGRAVCVCTLRMGAMHGPIHPCALCSCMVPLPPPESGDYSVYIGDLAPEVDETYLAQFFRAYYPSCRVAKVRDQGHACCSHLGGQWDHA
jgi:hypothetical protein